MNDTKYKSILKICCLVLILCFFLPFTKGCDRTEYPLDHVKVSLSNLFLFQANTEGYNAIMIAYFFAVLLFLCQYSEQIFLFKFIPYLAIYLFFMTAIVSLRQIGFSFQLRDSWPALLILLSVLYGVTLFFLRKSIKALFVYCVLAQLFMSALIHGLFAVDSIGEMKRDRMIYSPPFSFLALVVLLYCFYRVEISSYPKGYFFIWKKNEEFEKNES
ncbi:MAG: hypothetical protein HQM15_03890 [Deltaproteobacteria bacterium]|nr:hypothetical protein [Deltaproteobacteria bacterium]